MNARRRHWYFAMMGTCVVFFVLAWSVVRLWSVPAAIGMCVFAMVIPPVAAIVANRKGPEDRWWDEPADPRKKAEQAAPEPDKRALGGSGDPQSDAWWAELDEGNRKNRHDL